MTMALHAVIAALRGLDETLPTNVESVHVYVHKVDIVGTTDTAEITQTIKSDEHQCLMPTTYINLGAVTNEIAYQINELKKHDFKIIRCEIHNGWHLI